MNLEDYIKQAEELGYYIGTDWISTDYDVFTQYLLCKQQGDSRDSDDDNMYSVGDANYHDETKEEIHLQLWTEAQAKCAIPELASPADYRAKYTAELVILKEMAAKYEEVIEEVQQKLDALDGDEENEQ